MRLRSRFDIIIVITIIKTKRGLFYAAANRQSNLCAVRWGISSAEAYHYLHEHGGITFLIDCYEAEHQLSIDDAVDDLALICRYNGGTRL